MRPTLTLLSLLGPVVLGGVASAAAPPPPPKAAPRPAVEAHHGRQVPDPYQWLEASTDAEVKAWTQGQNAHTRGVLEALPARDAIRRRITHLLSWQSPAYVALREEGGTLFAVKAQPPRQQPLLVVLESLTGAPPRERVLLDPMVLDPSGHSTIEWFVPTRDGKRVAVAVSKGGTESGDVTVYDVASGKPLPGDVVPRVNGGTAGGSLAWNADGSGFFYTRYPRGEERPQADRDFFQQVFFHKLGTPTEQDTYELGRDFPRIAMTTLKADVTGRHVVALVANGDGGEYALYARKADGSGWTQVSRFEDGVVGADFGKGSELYVLSRKGAPRGEVLRLDAADPKLATAVRVVPEGEASLQAFRPGKDRLYLLEQLGGPSRVRMVGKDGKALGLVPTPPVSSVGGLVLQEDGGMLLAVSGYTQPLAWFRYAPGASALTPTALAQTSPLDTRNVEVVREECTSADGTKVPLTLIQPRGLKRDGRAPALLTGYGGFNLSIGPGFNKLYLAFVEQGGVVAVANLRGGSEFGAEWHEAGMLTRKQNVFDDFYACAQRLVELRVTTPQRLGIQGGSNGGLLMGAALTQHPELFRAVVARVGIYDMLRVERTPNGQFNVTEYGSVKDPEQFRALLAYSPYHRVKDGTKYPAAIFTSGDNDPRVDPFHSRKMVARLQAASTSGRPVLLRASGDTGHGAGTPLSAKIEEEVDVYAFLFHELGVRYREVPSKLPAPKAK